MGTPRWQLREIQQQRLLEKLMDEAFKEAEKLGDIDQIFLLFFHDFADYLSTERQFHFSFLHKAADDIAQFSRTGGEARYLLWRFFEKIMNTISTQFKRDYSRETIMEQERLYGGNSTDEVGAEELKKALGE